MRSPRGPRKFRESLASRKAEGGARPSSEARAIVKLSTTPPAASLLPSTPSVARLATQGGNGKSGQGRGGGHRQLLVAAALAVPPHGDRGLSSRDQADRGPRRPPLLHALAQDRHQDARHLPRLALEPSGEDEGPEAQPAGFPGGGLDAQAVAADYAKCSRCGRADRRASGSRAPRRAHRLGGDGGPLWEARSMTPRRRRTSRASSNVREIRRGGPGGDRREVVAHDVGEDEGGHRGRRRRPCEATALQPRQVLPDRVQLVDGRARRGAGARWSGALSSRVTPATGAGRRAEAPPDRRSSSRSSLPQRPGERLDFAGGVLAALVRDGMGRDTESHAPKAGSVRRRHRESAFEALPEERLRGPGHRHRRFSDRDEDEPAPPTRDSAASQVIADEPLRIGGPERGGEDASRRASQRGAIAIGPAQCPCRGSSALSRVRVSKFWRSVSASAGKQARPQMWSSFVVRRW